MIIESISGNIHDLPSEDLEDVHVESVVLPLADLTKRIQRVRSDHGTELGIRLAPGVSSVTGSSSSRSFFFLSICALPRRT